MKPEVKKEEDDKASREGLRLQDLENLRASVGRIEDEYKKFADFKTSFSVFTKKMNEVSNANIEDQVDDSISHRLSNRPLSGQSISAHSSQKTVNSLLDDREKQVAKKRKKVRPIDSEFGLDDEEEAKNVLVSPKSSLISSRLASPETADAWASCMIKFATLNEHLI